MNVQIYRVLNHRLTIPVSIGVGSFVAGSGVGYFFARYQASRYIPPEPVEDEDDGQLFIDFSVLDNVSTSLSINDKKLEFEDPEEELEEDPEMVDDSHNIFDPPDNNGGWDSEKELLKRDIGQPYIIHVDEFINSEDYKQKTLTYYQGDEILTDENDVPVYNYASVVGELKFGHGSNDPNAVYIRNESLRAEYEILLSLGSYQTEVLGQEIEADYRNKDLRHSNISKFKLD